MTKRLTCVYVEEHRLFPVVSHINLDLILRQVYEHVEIVFVSPLDRPSFLPSDVRYVQGELGQTFGELCNLVLADVETEYFTVVQPNQWNNPLRLAYQMAHVASTRPCSISTELICDVSDCLEPGSSIKPTFYQHTDAAGVPEAAVFPSARSDGQKVLCPESDSTALAELWASFSDVVVLDTSAKRRAGLESIFARFYSGIEGLSRDDFFAGCSELNTDVESAPAWLGPMLRYYQFD